MSAPASLAAALSLAAAAAAAAAAAPQPPPWSWATLPTFHHAAKTTGDYDAAQLAELARYPLVVVEKFQAVAAPQDNRTEEERIVDACRGVKALRAGTACVFYLNSVIAFPQYAYAQELRAARPDLWLRDDGGVAINMSGPGWPSHVPPFPVLDYALPAARAFFAAACTRAVASGAVDGCFLDREVDVGASFAARLPADRAAAWAAGHATMAAELQAALGAGTVVANHMTSAAARIPGVRGCMFEALNFSEASLSGLLWAASEGLVCEVHVEPECSEATLALYLLAAEPSLFYGCGGWASATGMNTRPAFFDYPLGAPLGPLTNASGVLRREFASGTVAEVDFANKTALVRWAKGAPPRG